MKQRWLLYLLFSLGFVINILETGSVWWFLLISSLVGGLFALAVVVYCKLHKQVIAVRVISAGFLIFLGLFLSILPNMYGIAMAVYPPPRVNRLTNQCQIPLNNGGVGGVYWFVNLYLSDEECEIEGYPWYRNNSVISK